MRCLPISFFFIVSLFCSLFNSAAFAGPINAKSAILMDVTRGRILYEQRADIKIPPASLTKVMSMYVAMNAISAKKLGYNTKVKVSVNAARTGGSRLGLRAGERLTIDQLFYGMAVASGNDASVAVAERVAGSTSAFVSRMNSLAKRIGMKNTRFVNVHGLPAQGQLTTARDMLNMARFYQRSYPTARRYHLAPSVVHNGHREFNHNPLVGTYQGVDGLKTGWIADTYNIIATARRNGHKLIAVILGAPNTKVRAAEARRLLSAGFSAISKKKGSVIAELGVSAKEAAQLKKSFSPAPKKIKKGSASSKTAKARKSQAAKKNKRQAANKKLK